MNNNNNNMNTILIVDDETKIRNMYHKYLSAKGFNILEASNAMEAYNILMRKNTNPVDIILLDINMPETNGEILYNVTKLIHKNFKIIVSSVYPIDDQMEIIKGAAAYFDKSHNLTELIETIKIILEKN